MSFSNTIKELKAPIKELLLKSATLAGKAIGRDCLNRESTRAFLAENGIGYVAGEISTLKRGGEITNLEILESGIVRVNRSHCLYFDYGNRAALRSFKKPTVEVEHAIAVWSHPWLGYYHFLSELVPKVLKLKEDLGADLGGAKICYPFIHRSYENELQSMLGFPEGTFVDSRSSGGLIANRVSAIPMAGWYKGNPNLDLLRKQFVSEASAKGPRRIYLSRAGRRKCRQEQDLITLCKSLGFHIIPEPAPSVENQIELFSNAQIIFGPHGGAFTNLVWAPSGCHVVELVPTTYDVPYYKNLAEQCSLKYTKLLCDNGPPLNYGIEVDFDVNLDTVALELKNILNIITINDDK